MLKSTCVESGLKTNMEYPEHMLLMSGPTLEPSLEPQPSAGNQNHGCLMQVNIFMGIGLLSMPFAMRQGGWVGMLALAIATAVFCISGKLIVRNFEKMPPDVAHTYPALGELIIRTSVSCCLPCISRQCEMGSYITCQMTAWS